MQAYVRLTVGLQLKLKRCFRRVAELAWDRSGWCVGLVVVLAVLLALGFLGLQSESSGEKVWVPQSSEGKKQFDFVRDTYPSDGPRPQSVIGLPKGNPNNVLTTTALLAALALHERVTSLNVSVDGRVYTYEDLCLRPFANSTHCSISSPLVFWDWNATAIIADAATYGNTIQRGAKYPWGAPVQAQAVLSRLEPDYSTSSAMKLVWLLQHEDDIGESVAEAWEEEFLLFMEEYVTRSENVLEWRYSAAKSFADGISESTLGDLQLVAVAYFIMTLYTCFLLSRPRCGRTRIFLALGGVATVLLGTGAGFGLASAMTVVWTPITPILPFILMGIGLDDAFVFVDSVDQHRQPRKGRDGGIPEPREAFIMGVGDAGVSILVTTLTDVMAFLLGATSVLPVIRAFCLYAALSVFFIFLFVNFFFLACFAISTRLQTGETVNCLSTCCCVGKAQPSEPEPLSLAGRLTHGVGNAGKALTKTPVKVVIIVIFLAIAGVSVWKGVSLQRGLPLEDLLPDSHYARLHVLADQEWFEELGPPVHLYDKEGLDYHNPQTKAWHWNMQQRMLHSQWIDSTVPPNSWYDEFWEHLNSTYGSIPPEEQFYGNLTQWLAAEEQDQFKNDVIFVSGSNRIFSSRVLFYHTGAAEAEDNRIDAMDDTRAAVENDRGLFPFFRAYIFYEQDKTVPSEAVQNIGLTGLAVFLVGCVFLMHPWIAFLVWVTVMMIDFSLLGAMGLWDVRMNGIAIINLVMSLGLSFDYVGHLAHTYALSQGTGNQRIVRSLRRRGGAVLNGGLSTFLAVCMLAFAESVIFRTFFKMFLVIVVSGLLHGLVFFPVVVSLIGPKPLTLEDGKEALSEEEEPPEDSTKDMGEAYEMRTISLS